MTRAQKSTSRPQSAQPVESLAGIDRDRGPAPSNTPRLSGHAGSVSRQNDPQARPAKAQGLHHIRRSRAPDRAQNAAPERRPSFSWRQRISAPTRAAGALVTCEAHDRSVAVRPGALATGSIVQSRSLSSRSRCSVLEFGARASPTESGISEALLLAVPTGIRRNRKRGRHLTTTSRLTPMWPHLGSVFSNVTSHLSVRAIGRL